MIISIIFLLITALNNIKCHIDYNAIKDIDFCNSKGRCRAIGDFNLLIKTPCTELDLIEFVSDKEVYQKFVTQDFKLVDKSEPSKNTTVSTNFTNNFSVINLPKLNNSLASIFKELKDFFCLMFDEINDYVSYCLVLILFVLILLLKKR